MTITFSGLASGIDTASIVESIIEIESAPLTTMESNQEYLETKLDAYSEFNTMLETFADAVSGLNSETDLNSYDVTNNGTDYFSVSTTSATDAGTYSVEVVSLAQQQKDVTNEGFSDTDETLLSGELQIGSETLSYDGVTLTELVDLIEEGDYGISASIVDTGTENGYRLLLTTDTAGETIEIVGTGDITLDTATDGHTVEGAQAHVVVDGVDYYSANNTMTTAIPGTTLTLQAESDSGADKVIISSDTEGVISSQLEEMVSAYNALTTYVDTIAESDPTLANSMKTLQRSLRNYLTSSNLVSLGIESDWETGQLSLDSSKLSEAYEEDPDGVKTLLLGDDESDGIMTRIDDYLTGQLDDSEGFLAVKQSSIEAKIAHLDDSISAMETRLEKRQETLEAQFSAMETLISSLNSQGDYLTSFFESYSTTS